MSSPLENLNPDQLRAVTSKAKHLLVLAGAGSGKTFVLTRRIIHLVGSGAATPEHILAITFTRNAAREMSRRLESFAGESADNRAGTSGFPNISRVTVRTFHSLCYFILRRHWKLLFNQPFQVVTDTLPSGKPARVGGRALKTKSDLLLDAAGTLFCEPDFRIEFKRYLWNYMVQIDEADRYGSGFDTRPQNYTTLSGERVRSYAERDIANWLFENGIRYRYDQPVYWGKPLFRSDFYLPEQDAYLEVWEFSGRQQKEREAKLARYRARRARLIEVERDQLLDFPALEKRLIKTLPEVFPQGETPGAAGDLDTLESAELGYPEALKSFLSLAEEVLDKMKNHSVDPAELAERARGEKHTRTKSFYSIFLRIYDQYQKNLSRESALDFNELILQTVELFRRNPQLRERYRARWSHILVDEYQDVNTPQVELLKELVGPANRLTCVGDDWQSIYGFRGSEVAHILNFEEEFPSPEVVPLRVNYRNSGPVVDFANLSIRRSAEYRDKPSIALKRTAEPVLLYRAQRLNEDGVGYVVESVRDLVGQAGYGPGDILILYRRSASFRLLGEVLRQAGLKVRHETIHAAKGLEAPVVFLWALVGGRGGFPSIWEEGRIMRLLLPFQKLHRMDEERRIFYVALTRASERLFLISEQHNPSKFLENVSERHLAAPGVSEPKSGRPDKPGPCPCCKGPLPPEYRFCPLCFHGLEKMNP